MINRFDENVGYVILENSERVFRMGVFYSDIEDSGNKLPLFLWKQIPNFWFTRVAESPSKLGIIFTLTQLHSGTASNYPRERNHSGDTTFLEAIFESIDTGHVYGVTERFRKKHRRLTGIGNSKGHPCNPEPVDLTDEHRSRVLTIKKLDLHKSASVTPELIKARTFAPSRALEKYDLDSVVKMLNEVKPEHGLSNEQIHQLLIS